MTSYVLTVNEENYAVKSLVNALKLFRKVGDVRLVRKKEYRLLEAVTLTEDEMKEVEKSRKSGICTTDISELQNYLKSVYEN